MKRRSFQRPLGERRYRKLFVIATEGAKTEPLYFAIFNSQGTTIKVRCIKGKHQSAPEKVLQRMKDYINRSGLRSTDEAWLVVDTDNWNVNQLAVLNSWSEKANNYGLAVSNPKFEYWLLLHFEDGNDISSTQQCSTKLQHYLPNYDKDVDSTKLIPGINDAIDRAKRRDQPPCQAWPHDTGTTVYRLVEKLRA